MSWVLVAQVVAGDVAAVDWTARGIAIVAAAASVGRLLWEITKYWMDGKRKLKTEFSATDEPRGLRLVVTNVGRRPVFVMVARLVYRLGGQDLHVDLRKANAPDQDRVLSPHGDAEVFQWRVNSDQIMQFRLGFQEDPDSLYISVLSQGGEVQRIPNKEVQGIVRHVLNEFDPEIP